jgi:hypothetical protein
MTEETRKPVKGWSAVKQRIKTWDTAQLTALIKDLYDSSSDNRAFLDARLQADDGGGAALETYRQRIVQQFFPKRGFGQLKLAEARKAIRDYKRATGNVEGTIELLLTYLENGNDFTCRFGDIDERFYDSLCSVIDELAAALKSEGPEAYAKVRDRLDQVATNANGIGWGYGDHINGVVGKLEDALGDS